MFLKLSRVARRPENPFLRMKNKYETYVLFFKSYLNTVIQMIQNIQPEIHFPTIRAFLLFLILLFFLSFLFGISIKLQNIYINQSPLPFFIYDEQTSSSMPNVMLKSNSFSTSDGNTEAFHY